MENIIELQSNKIYIIVTDNKKIANFILEKLSNKEESIDYKISKLSESPDRIRYLFILLFLEHV